IGKVTAALVPVMIVFYILAALFVLAVNAGDIPAALGFIFHDAFTGSSAAGGFTAAVFVFVIQSGFDRRRVSKKAGLGSAPITAAAPQTTNPVRQGLVSMTQTFIDTINVVTMTGLVIVTTGAYKLVDPDTGERMSAALMPSEGFAAGLPGQW